MEEYLKYLLFLSVFLLLYLLWEKDPPDGATLLSFFRRLGLPAMVAVAFFVGGSICFFTPLAGFFTGILGWHLVKNIDYHVTRRKMAIIKRVERDFVTTSAGLYMSGQTNKKVIETVVRDMPQPLAGDFMSMLGANRLKDVPFSDLFEDLGKKYKSNVFMAVGKIISAGENTGTTKTMGSCLQRLGNAIRRTEKMMLDRRKSTQDPMMAGLLAIAVLLAAAALDATLLRELFAGSVPGKLLLALGVGITVGIILIFFSLMKNTDLE